MHGNAAGTKIENVLRFGTRIYDVAASACGTGYPRYRLAHHFLITKQITHTHTYANTHEQ